MIEREIFYITGKKLHSEKKNKDYYLVVYIKGNDTPKTDYVDALEYDRISKKAKPYTKCTGLFSINDYDQPYLCDIK